jgi:hypothetical protein
VLGVLRVLVVLGVLRVLMVLRVLGVLVTGVLVTGVAVRVPGPVTGAGLLRKAGREQPDCRRPRASAGAAHGQAT